jgi:hypothetical protein
VVVHDPDGQLVNRVERRRTHELKTLPSRMTSIDLARLRTQSTRPAGPPPARPSWDHPAAGAPIEIYRTVNATGAVSIAGKPHSIGQRFAGRRITLRLEATSPTSSWTRSWPAPSR